LENSQDHARKTPRYDLDSLKEKETASIFAHRFVEISKTSACKVFPADGSAPGDNDCQKLMTVVTESLHAAAAETVPVITLLPQRPWIQATTLNLIGRRNDARKTGDRSVEVALNKEIRKSARADRGNWLNNIVETGAWAEVKKLKKSRNLKVGNRKLHDSIGKLVESNQRADTFANHLETVQWAVRPMSDMVQRPPLGPVIPSCEGQITPEELRIAIKQLKLHRAAVQVPAEFLRALLDAGEIHEDSWLLKLMRECWQSKTTPTEWHVSKVVPIYKKGDPANCDNYRPISLVSVLYKLYAKLLLNRLKAAGAEERLWSRQFGFRSKRSTEDALFIVRRRVEQALASRGGRAFLLALDWRKAFDSIAPERLIWALERFGVNGSMLAAIQEIYANRDFTVSDGGVDSQSRPQKAGISQGCPLSPFLFGMVMTVLMWDARNALSTEAKLACDKGELEDTLFADDTLLIGRCGEHIEEYMAQVELKGRDYGLQVHWGKVCLVKVCADSPIHGPSGQVLEAKDSMSRQWQVWL
jgi:hypothetical protein